MEALEREWHPHWWRCVYNQKATTAHAQAAKTFVLKLNHVLGKEPYHGGFIHWAAKVAERTQGGLKIEVFHSAQLGKEEDVIEQNRCAKERASRRTPMRRVWATTYPASR